jgi:hypothetical protein
MSMSKFGIWRETNYGEPVAGTNAPVASNLNNPAETNVEDANGALARLIKFISPVKSISGNVSDMADILVRINQEILKRNKITVKGVLPRAQAMKVFNALMGQNSPTNENK